MSTALAFVGLKKIVIDVRAVVGRGVPPQVDARFGALDQLGREGLIRLTGFRQERYGIAGST